ncbi:hypothetical protein CYMTET_10141 [Cymbomonas tetramitiformis]|uniref:Thiopurine S-methyltransferase n=1 Tax=Cymbomonas tetramitiformis TaxID=36881 RepID=A0AAE0GPQ1_9CHLO|nr:hypothetical protein CYMTET_10141 [Cymbomonas tetramitiformis]|eukprot:gene13352-15778_t
MPYLAEKPNVQEVIGVEGVREAITQFIHENSALKFDECAAETPGFETWRSSKITLVLGDFFDIQEHHIGLVDKIWDRAALVAVDPALREAYVDSMDRVLRPGGQILLVTFDRAAGSLNGMRHGPPFSVPEAEVRRLFEDRYEIQLLERKNVINEYQRFQDQGVTTLYEDVFLLTKKS